MSKEEKKLKLGTKILIINGGGFIGYHLCKKLLVKNCSVAILDKASKERKNKVKPFLKYKNLRYLNLDKKDPLKKAKAHHFDYLMYIVEKGNKGEILEQCLEFNRKQKSSLVLVVVNAEKKKIAKLQKQVANEFEKYNSNVRVIKIVDVYGRKMKFEKSDLGVLFLNWKNKQTFKIPGEGKKRLWPLFIDDAVSGIFKALLKKNTAGKTFTLAGQKTNAIELAKIFKKATDSRLGFEFRADKFERKAPKLKELRETKKQLGWKVEASIKKGIRESLKKISFERKEKRSVFKKKKWPRLLLLKVFPIILLTVFVIGIFALLPLAGALRYYNQETKKIKTLQGSFEKLDFDSLQKQAKNVSERAKRGKELILNYGSIAHFAGFDKYVNRAFTVFDLAELLSSISRETINCADELEDFNKVVLNLKEGSVQEKVDKIEVYLNKIWEDYSLLDSRQSEEAIGLKEKLPFERKEIKFARELIGYLPKILAFNGKYEYLLLIQDDRELRPTGGVIDDIAFLSFNKGKIWDFQVFATERIDSQLRGKREMPKALIQYTDNSSWKLRDSNWSADFSKSSAEAEWFLEQALEKKVDGVIGINRSFLVNMYGVFGKEEKAENNKELLKKIFEEFKTADKKELFKLCALFKKSLEEKEILFSFKNNKLANYFDKHGWTGVLRQTNKDEDVFKDYLMIVETNLGENKINPLVKRKVEQQTLVLANGDVEEETRIEYEVQKSEEGFVYKNYLRLYIPMESDLLEIKIGDNEQALEKLETNNINKELELDKKVVGFLVEIKDGENKIVEVKYRLGDKFEFDSESYAFYYQKQSGMSTSEFDYSFYLPAKMAIDSVMPEGEVTPNKAEFETNTKKDRLFVVNFAF